MTHGVLQRVSLIDGCRASDEALAHWNELLCDYNVSGLAPPHMWNEVAQGCAEEPQKLWSCLWEAMLYRHFKALRFKFRKDHLRHSGQHGPDLGLIVGSRTIWIEAVVPSGTGLPDAWIAPSAGMRVREPPEEAMLLRWTSVLRDKKQQYKKRLEAGVVEPGDPYVVAVNSYMLSGHPVQEAFISGPPSPVAAVYPVGKLSFTFAGKDGRSERLLRFSIKKPKGSDVPTTAFLEKEYEGISALIGCSRNDMLDGCLHLIAVHNLGAKNPVEAGRLGADREYVPDTDGNGNVILRL